MEIPDTNHFTPLRPIECEICCTEDVQPEDQAWCKSGHAFCKICVGTMAQEQLLKNQTNVLCMSEETCLSEFSQDEIRKCLDETLREKWIQLYTTQLLHHLDIHFETCPFCKWKCVLTGKYDFGIFMCGNGECLRWSCRTCKEEDHTPHTCAEAAKMLLKSDEKDIDNFLSEAVIRRCPKEGCFTPIERAEGCNHMTCTKCGTDFCYLCRRDITNFVTEHYMLLNICKQHGDPTPIIAKEYEEAKAQVKTEEVLFKKKREAFERNRKQAHQEHEERLVREKEFEAAMKANVRRQYNYWFN